MTKQSESSSFWFYFSLALGFLLSFSGIAGIVDGFVKWRKSIIPMLDLYFSFRSSMMELLPFVMPSAIFDYVVIGSSFAIGMRASRAARRPNRYSIIPGTNLQPDHLSDPISESWRAASSKLHFLYVVGIRHFHLFSTFKLRHLACILFWPIGVIRLLFFYVTRESTRWSPRWDKYEVWLNGQRMSVDTGHAGNRSDRLQHAALHVFTVWAALTVALFLIVDVKRTL